ncbi:zinc finger MYM-type protein 1-like [Aphis craccivora]|uniref:Zinc finger MYM-type protein 1-like n=1 Tax=Aphis craccivora TaxID=307492 RepID=A0A6G0XM05_APHCR|nr:zinc finger MYM-type protein 1-like [Aphis craccivora]
MSLPKNAKYTSNLIQNDILEAAAIVVGRSIVNEIKIGSDIFSIIADEARDIGKEEQMSLCIRYVSDCIIKERFLGFILLKDLDAQSLYNTIHKFLVSINLDITKCIAQSYDGASVMSDCNNGVQAKIRELSKNACPYVHCYAHRLNLVLFDTAKKVEALDEIIGLLEAIYAFQSFSTIRHNAFIQAQKDCGKIIEVPQHCETRWVSKYKGVHFFKSKFKCVIAALTEYSKNSKKKEAAEAHGLLHQFSSFHVILTLFYLDDILGLINNLSVYLQKSSPDIIKCLKLVKSTKMLLQNMRNEDKFNKLFDESVIAAQELDITILCNQTATISLSMPRRKMNLPSKLNNSYVYSTVGKNNSLKFKTVNEKDEIRHQYFEIIDTIIGEMNSRFDENIDILTAVDACDPNSSNFMDIEKLKYLVNIYGQDKMCNMETIASRSILVKNMFENTTINIVELHKELTIMKPAFQEINEIVTRV